MRLSQIIGLLDLTNQKQFKEGNGYKIRTKFVHDYWGVCLILNMRFIYYWHINVDLLGMFPCPPVIQTLESASQEWAWLEKEYLHSGWTSDSKV